MKLISTAIILALLAANTLGVILRTEYQSSRRDYFRRRCTYDGHQVDLYDSIPFGYPRCGMYECMQGYTMKVITCERNRSRRKVFPECCR